MGDTSGFGALRAKGRISDAQGQIAAIAAGNDQGNQKTAKIRESVQSIIESAGYIRKYFREDEKNDADGDVAYLKAIKPFEAAIRDASASVGMDPQKAVNTFRNPPLDDKGVKLATESLIASIATAANTPPSIDIASFRGKNAAEKPAQIGNLAMKNN